MKKFSLLFLPLLFIVLVGFTAGGDEKKDLEPFMKNAVLQGLTAEQFPKAVAQAILENSDNWVVKCPICRPVQAGFKAYIASSPDDTSEGEASRGVMEEFGDDDGSDEDKRNMLEEMINKYTTAHYTRLEMTDEEIAAMQEELVAGRKKGMGLAPNTPGFRCPSCEGAAEAKPVKAREESAAPTPED